MEWMKVVPKFYEKSKKAITYLTLLFTIIVLYGGHFLGTYREQLLPAALVIAFGILLESVFSINDRLQDGLGVIEYADINSAIPKMVDIIKKKKHQKHIIKIIASSGGTTTNVIIPSIIGQASRNIEIQILLMNPDHINEPGIPKHWALEIQATIKRLKQLSIQRKKNVSINNTFAKISVKMSV